MDKKVFSFGNFLFNLIVASILGGLTLAIPVTLVWIQVLIFVLVWGFFMWLLSREGVSPLFIDGGPS